MRHVSSLVKASIAALLATALEHCSSPNPYLTPRDAGAPRGYDAPPLHAFEDVTPFVPGPPSDASDVPPVDATSLTPDATFMAIDPRTETVFVADESDPFRRLWAVDFAPRQVRPLATGIGGDPWQMAFLDGYVVLASASLIVYRADSLREERRWPRQYTPVEMLASPSGHRLAVVERSDIGTRLERTDLRVLDPSSPQNAIIDTTPTSLFAWTPDADRLVQLVLSSRAAGPIPAARLRLWDFTAPTAVTAPSVDLTLPDLGPSQDGRIMVRADGRQIAFVSRYRGLQFIDVPSGEVHGFGDLSDALGYSADGRRFIALPLPSAWTVNRLEVIDPYIFTRVVQPLPTASAYDFAVTASGDRVVVSADRGGQDLAVLDTAQRTRTSASGLRARLDHAITRGASELWWADRGLYRLNAGRIEPVPLGWMPSTVGLLPRQGALVLDVPGQRRLVMLDLSTLRPVADAAYP